MPKQQNSPMGRWPAQVAGALLCLAVNLGLAAGYAHGAPNPPVVTGVTPTNDATPTWSWTSGGGGSGVFRCKLDGNYIVSSGGTLTIGTGYNPTGATLRTGGTDTTATSYTPVNALTEGRHVLYVQERDAAGAWSTTGNKAIAIDVTPPSPPVVAGVTLTLDTTPTWTWVSGGGGNGTYRYKLDDSSLESGATVKTVRQFTPTLALALGNHVLYVQERDPAGNWSASGSLAIFVDTKPGAPKLTGKTPTQNTKPTWSWTSGGGGNGSYRYKLDNTDLASGATETIQTTFTPAAPLGAGGHTLYVQERNANGFWSTSGTRTITVDLTPPNPPVVSGFTPTNDTTPSWSWVSGGNGGNGFYRYKLDDSNLGSGATVTSLTSFTPNIPLAPGEHVLYVQEKDAAGNWSVSSDKTIVIDLTPPNPPVVSGLTPTNLPTWSWTSGGNGGNGFYRYKLDDPNLDSGATGTSLTSFTPDAPLASGEHVLYVQEADAAGNWSAISSQMIWLARLPDTGQTKCYNDTGEIACPAVSQAYYGQDAQYTINPPSYTVHDDGTVTDNMTGLMWQREDDSTTRTWALAIGYCEDLSLAGYTDWRLPSRGELAGLANRDRLSPAIDTAAFPDTKWDCCKWIYTYWTFYWSSTTYLHYTDSAWVVDFYTGAIHDFMKDHSTYVRCVRGGQ